MQEAERTVYASEQQEAAASASVSWWKSEAATRWIYAVMGLAIIVAVLARLQFATSAVCCGDYDGYYHIRWSQLLWENFRQGKWLPEFIWLPLTTLSPETYADHHFFFHLLQIPFLWFFEPILAAKVGAVVFASLAVFSCFWLILRYRVEYPIIWLLALLVCSNPFYFRMNMAKAPPLSIIITSVGAFLLFERRYVWLAPLMFVFVWTYSLFPMLLVAAGIWTLILAWNENRFEWRPLTYAAIGAIAGNIINPYFPTNLKLFIEHAQTKLRAGGYQVAVGGEWYPYDSSMLLGSSVIAFIAMLVGYLLYRPDERRLDEKSTFFLIFATIFMIWTFQSKRMAEYFPPLAILFAAFAWQAFYARQIVPNNDASFLPEDVQRDLEGFLDKTPATPTVEKPRDWWQNAFVSLLSLLLFGWLFATILGVKVNDHVYYKGLRQELAENDPPDRYQKSMEWANANIPDGERIFNTDWDDFPKMFFHDQKHVYIAGLDPNYLYSRNPELSKLYEEITTGKVDDPAPLIREKFDARYVFSDTNHDDFYGKAMDSGWFDEVYQDNDSLILKIRDEKGKSPAEENQTSDEPTDEESNEAEEAKQNTEPEDQAQNTEAQSQNQ